MQISTEALLELIARGASREQVCAKLGCTIAQLDEWETRFNQSAQKPRQPLRSSP